MALEKLQRGCPYGKDIATEIKKSGRSKKEQEGYRGSGTKNREPEKNGKSN